MEDDGDVGFGTTNPVVDGHFVDGNTPTVRLEQDGSDGFTPQTWDVAGNETNFFIRDVTNGSLLSFRIRPGAPESSIDIASDGDVGIGTASPDGALDIEQNGSDGDMMRFTNTGTAANVWSWVVNGNNGRMTFNSTPSGGSSTSIIRMEDTANSNLLNIGIGAADTVSIGGNLTISGDCNGNANPTCQPDYVFEPHYALMSLEELSAYVKANKHLPNVPSATAFDSKGINLNDMSYVLLEKVEELVLYTLQQQETIDELRARLEKLEQVTPLCNPDTR